MNSDLVEAANVPLIGGRRFWIYGGDPADQTAINSAFDDLAAKFDPAGEDPLGLCLVLDPGAAAKLPRDARWQQSQMTYAGTQPDGSQLRIRYFDDAAVGPGMPISPSTQDMREIVVELEDRYRIELFSQQEEFSPEDVIAFWEREGAVAGADARRRVHEVQLIGIDRDEGVVAVSTAYLSRNAQLRMDLWYYRGCVGAAHRSAHLATMFALQGRDALERPFVAGSDTRGAGIIFEIENVALRAFYNKGVWEPSDYTFIGENDRGSHVRVHFFHGAQAPTPA